MDNDRYATLDEVRRAIEELTDEEHVKLQMFAAVWFKKYEARLRHVLEPLDLLGEAFKATLEAADGGAADDVKGRRWRQGIDFLRHMDWAMRSIAWAAAQRAKTAREGVRELKHVSYREDRAPPVSSAEEAAVARDELAAIEVLFADDSEALNVLRCRAEGKQGEEVRSELRLSKTDYATVCRRVKRKLATLLKQ